MAIQPCEHTKTHLIPHLKVNNFMVGRLYLFLKMFHVWGRAPKAGVLWQPRGMEWGGRCEEVQEGGDMCMPMAESYWCMAKTITILQNNYPSIKINKKILKNVPTL